jgi:hypothetical protein
MLIVVYFVVQILITISLELFDRIYNIYQPTTVSKSTRFQGSAEERCERVLKQRSVRVQNKTGAPHLHRTRGALHILSKVLQHSFIIILVLKRYKILVETKKRNHAWKVTSQVLTHPSAPPEATVFSPTHDTLDTPPGFAPLIAIFLLGLSMLQIYTFVSRDPEAQCLPSLVHARELILAEWNVQRSRSLAFWRESAPTL